MAAAAPIAATHMVGAVEPVQSVKPLQRRPALLASVTGATVEPEQPTITKQGRTKPTQEAVVVAPPVLMLPETSPEPAVAEAAVMVAPTIRGAALG